MTTISVHSEPVTHIRLFLALSMTAHLLAFAWNTPSLIFSGRMDDELSVTLDGNQSGPATPPVRQEAMRLHEIPLRSKISDENTVFSAAETATPATAVRELPQATPEDSDDQAATRAYLRSRLLTNFANYFHYPALARRKGWEGTVLLGLRVESDGQLDKIRLEHSSGYAVLDNSALNSLKRIGNLVEARVWLEGQSIDMQLPVIYKLIDN